MQPSRFLVVNFYILCLALGAFAQETQEHSDGQSKIAEQLADYMTRTAGKKFSGTVLVAHAGEKLLHSGYGYSDHAKEIINDTLTVYDIGSISKQFTAAAILKLEMQSKLSVNDPIDLYLPEFNSLTPSRSIHHLLTHTAGFPGAIGNDYDPITEKEFIQMALESVRNSSFKEAYNYSNVGYSLLAIIVERVSGLKYEVFLNEYLLGPAGMQHTGYVIPNWDINTIAIGYRKGEAWGRPVDKKWSEDGPFLHLKGNGGILSTSGDLYKWHKALMGDEVLSAEAKNKYYKKHVPESADESSFYGYGWAIFPTIKRGNLIAHNGGNGIFFADFLRFLDTDQTIIVLSNASNKTSENLAPKLAGIIK